MIPNDKIRFDFQQSFPVDLLGPAYDRNSLNFIGMDTEFGSSPPNNPLRQGYEATQSGMEQGRRFLLVVPGERVSIPFDLGH